MARVQSGHCGFCGGPMKPLFTSLFCPNDCDKDPRAAMDRIMAQLSTPRILVNQMVGTGSIVITNGGNPVILTPPIPKQATLNGPAFGRAQVGMDCPCAASTKRSRIVTWVDTLDRKTWCVTRGTTGQDPEWHTW